jgi:multiple sugar transport system substrate-binding protein
LASLHRIILTTVLLVATGCVSPPQPVGFDGRGPIVFVDGPDTSLNSQIARLVDEWNDRRGYSEHVEFREMPFATDDYRAQLRAHAQDLVNAAPGEHAEQCYDVMTLDVIWTAEFADAGYLVSLDADKFNVDRMLRRPVEAVKRNDRLWAVPMRTDPGLLYYRKDLVRAPSSWTELIDAARTAGPRHGIDGYVGQFDQYEGLTVNAVEAIWANGGDVLTPDGDVVVDSVEARRGVRMLIDGIEQGWIPRDALRFNEERSREAFQQGNAVFLRNWPYVYSQLADSRSPVADTFGVAPLPGPSALGGWNLGISSCSTHQATARDFIEFVTSEENQRNLFMRAGFAPTIASLYDDEELRDEFPYLEVLRRSVEQSRLRPTTPYYEDVSDAIQELVTEALTNPRRADHMVTTLAQRLAAVSKGR